MKKALLLTLTFFLISCGSAKPPPVYVYGTQNKTGAGVHAVQEGDTLTTIAERYGISLQNLVEANNMSAPYKLYVGQRLKLPPPNAYKVQFGDSVYSVSRLFGIDTYRLSQENNLRAPYVLRVGQIIRIPYSTRAQKQVFNQTPEQTIRPNRKPPSKAVQQTMVENKPPKRTGRFVRPVSGDVVSKFGPQNSGLHNDGINILAPRGAPVGSAENGVVVYVGDQIKGQGNLVLIRHQDQFISAYGHLDSIAVSRGDVVQAGQTIGRVGATGNVSQPQLHFEIRRGTEAVDPARYI